MPEEEEKEKYLSAADDQETWTAVLKDSVKILEDEGIQYMAVGSIAISALGYEEEPSDIDLLIGPGEAERALKVFQERGYDTEVSEPDWLYKAVKDKVLVDLIFAVGDKNEMSADDEMFRRARETEVGGQAVKVVAPEDFLVMQAISNKEEASEYWYKGLKAALADDLDWDYVLMRGGMSPPRVLSLLLYATSEGARIPRRVLDELYASVKS